MGLSEFQFGPIFFACIDGLCLSFRVMPFDLSDKVILLGEGLS